MFSVSVVVNILCKFKCLVLVLSVSFKCWCLVLLFNDNVEYKSLVLVWVFISVYG